MMKYLLPWKTKHYKFDKPVPFVAQDYRLYFEQDPDEESMLFKLPTEIVRNFDINPKCFLAVETKHEHSAYFAGYLVHATITILHQGSEIEYYPAILPYSYLKVKEQQRLKLKSEYQFREIDFGDNSVSCAAYLSSIIAKDRKLINATTLLFQSYDTAYLPNRYKNPYHTDEIILNYKIPLFSFRYGLAIIHAYSTIEQLGLQIIAKENEEPAVSIEKTKQKLSKIGINPDRKIRWINANQKRNLKPRSISRFNEKFDDNFHYETITIYEALENLRHWRGKLSHTIKLETSDLNLFDVCNCQELARYLLIKSTGFNYFED